jgi:hypothetical protein
MTPGLTLRTEPDHSEAFVHLGPGGQVNNPVQWHLVSEALRTWATEQGVNPSDLGVRLTFSVPVPRAPESGPDCDFAVPCLP